MPSESITKGCDIKYAKTQDLFPSDAVSYKQANF